MTSSGSLILLVILFLFFFFNDPATTEIYTLSLHDALPILMAMPRSGDRLIFALFQAGQEQREDRSEEHTSELQSHVNLVCRLLLEKKKKTKKNYSQGTRASESQKTRHR